MEETLPKILEQIQVPDRAGQAQALSHLADLFDRHVLRPEDEDHALLTVSRSVRETPALLPGVVPFAARIGPAFLMNRKPEGRGRFAGVLSEITDQQRITSYLIGEKDTPARKELPRIFNAAAKHMSGVAPKVSVLFAAAADFSGQILPAIGAAAVLSRSRHNAVALFHPDSTGILEML